MGPWKLIGAVAGGAASIAAVTGLFFLIQGAVIWAKGQIEDNLVDAVNEETHKWELIVRDNADASRVKDVEDDKIAADDKAKMQEQINGLFATIDRQIDQSPYLADIALHRTYYRIMCKIENTGNNEARRACDIRASQAPTPDSTPFVSIGRQTIDNWAALCEDTGEEVYCNPRSIGLRTQSAQELVEWMLDVDEALGAYDRNIILLTDQLHLAQRAVASTVEEMRPD